MSEAQYKLKQYRPGAWAIVEKRVVPEINERTGKPNREPGVQWIDIKYPGTLRNAVDRLLEIMAGGEDEMGVDELKSSLIACSAEISANVSQYLLQCEGVTMTADEEVGQ